MKHTIEIDLRKSNPIGVDVAAQFDRCSQRYQAAKQLGSGDPSKSGWYAHNQEFLRLRNDARSIHSLLVTISELVGAEVTSKIKALKWAVTHDFNGEKK